LAMGSGATAFVDGEDATGALEDFFVRDPVLGGTHFRCGWEAEVSRFTRRTASEIVRHLTVVK
jgi:hypothetical protein